MAPCDYVSLPSPNMTIQICITFLASATRPRHRAPQLRYISDERDATERHIASALNTTTFLASALRPCLAPRKCVTFLSGATRDTLHGFQ